MNRAFYIVGIVFSFVYVGLMGNYTDEVDSVRFYNSLSDYSYGSYSSYSFLDSGIADDLTSEAALVSLFFIFCFIAIDIFGLIKVKTKTMKVMGILGLCFSAIFLLWDFAVLASPGAMSFDEVGPAFSFYGTVMLAFTIVGLVQSVRFFKYPERYLNGGQAKQEGMEVGDLLDS